MLYVVRCTLYVVRCTLYVVRDTWYVVRCMLHVVRGTWYVVCCTLYAVRYNTRSALTTEPIIAVEVSTGTCGTRFTIFKGPTGVVTSTTTKNTIATLDCHSNESDAE